METCPSRSGTKSRTAPDAVSCSRKRARSVTTCQLTWPIAATGGRECPRELGAPPHASVTSASLSTPIAGRDLPGGDHQGRRNRGQALAPPRQPEPVGGGGRHRHRRAQQARQHLLRLVAARAELRPVADHLYSRVTDPVAVLR